MPERASRIERCSLGSCIGIRSGVDCASDTARSELALGSGRRSSEREREVSAVVDMFRITGDGRAAGIGYSFTPRLASEEQIIECIAYSIVRCHLVFKDGAVAESYE